MDPQITLLPTQPQIRLSDALGAHPGPRAHFVALLALVTVRDAAVGHRVHDVQPAPAVLARQALRQHAHARAAGAIGRVLGVRAQRAECAGEDEGALFRHWLQAFWCGV